MKKIIIFLSLFTIMTTSSFAYDYMLRCQTNFANRLLQDKIFLTPGFMKNILINLKVLKFTNPETNSPYQKFCMKALFRYQDGTTEKKTFSSFGLWLPLFKWNPKTGNVKYTNKFTCDIELSLISEVDKFLSPDSACTSL